MKKFLCISMVLILTVSLCTGCSSSKASAPKQSGLTKVTLNEVAHSIFYAPQYVAVELGYFKEEGIDLTLVTGFGADKTMTALLAGDSDIGFMGSEGTMHKGRITKTNSKIQSLYFHPLYTTSLPEQMFYNIIEVIA